MIFATGDTHGNFQRFGAKHFPEQKEMSRSDHVIICGDFGGVWADTPNDFLEKVKTKADYHYWLFGHYHDNRAVDEKHILLWEQMVQVI